MLSNLLVVVSLAVGLFCFTASAQAQVGKGTYTDIGRQLEAAGGSDGAGLELQADPRKIVVRIINVSLSLIGTIMFALMVYSGFLWMTAGGNEEQVTQAKTTIRNCVIGLIIVLMSWAITLAVTNLATGRDLGASQNNTPGGAKAQYP